MRRLLRWALNVAAAVSATLFVATCVLWVRSYSAHADQRSGRYSGGQYTILSRYSDLPIDLKPDPPARPAAHSATGVTTDRASLPGFQWAEYRVRYSNGSSAWTDLESETVLIAYWLPALALVLTPAAALMAEALRRSRGRTRLAARLCPACCYDLRATPDRCPECGAACKAADPAGASPAAGD